MKLWIVGKVSKENHLEWGFQGVFDNEQKANAVCEDETWFIGPIILNEEIPSEPDICWPEAYYPIGDCHCESIGEQ